jgi:anion-transporting  ArsA/GET3 family ATPase
MLSELPRVLFVIGKGGVGRSTVSAALAELCMAAGERTLLVEASGAEIFGPWYGDGEVGYEGRALDGSGQLHAMSLSPRLALREYLLRQVRFRLLYRLVFDNRPMRSFLDAVLGLGDLISVGKVADLERATRVLPEDGATALAWDRIIVDMPATGHGLSMLNSPRAMAEITRTGPLHRNAEWVQELLDDPRRSAIVLVTWAEELPVTEAVESMERMGEDGLPAPRIVLLSGLPEAPLAPNLRSALDRLATGAEDDGFADAARAYQHRLAAAAQGHRFAERLRDACPSAAFWTLPLLARGVTPLQRVRAVAELIGEAASAERSA